ncbi:hypothetical protein WDV76_15000 [Xenorhabdus griffiniae]|uniref:hypothetical protein n=1 Tax=Xenorhabdus griffiniae TaxID=351672 RepID=UPI002359FA1F|nr:hypothetical protein [Xenorhabdus griffiniae]MDC9606044.1 hypothetical protein [Xenorhabdus griffiniae]
MRNSFSETKNNARSAMALFELIRSNLPVSILWCDQIRQLALTHFWTKTIWLYQLRLDLTLLMIYEI